MTLSVVTVSYKRPDRIHVLLRSFLCQTSMDWTMHVLHDGPDLEMETILASYAEQWPQHFSYEFTEQRYNDWGHTLRGMGIQKATGEHLLITNDDNYYAPIFVIAVQNAFRETGCDGVHVDMIHSHENPGFSRGPAYSFFPTQPQRGQVDVGCVVIRTEMAKQIGWRDKGHSGDATYIEDAGRIPGFKWTKIPQVLFVHN